MVSLGATASLAAVCLRALEPAHVRQSAFGAAADGDEFGEDGDGNLFGRDGADVEADRRVHAIEQLGAEPFAREFAEDGNGFAFGAEHADVARRGSARPSAERACRRDGRAWR